MPEIPTKEREKVRKREVGKRKWERGSVRMRMRERRRERERGEKERENWMKREGEMSDFHEGESSKHTGE